MEAKITIIEISPRLPYLKTVITDSFSISFLYDDNIIKIEDLESYLSKSEPPYISLPNISQSYIYFYLLKNGKYIMGIGEIPLVNSVKWYNLKEFNNKEFIFTNINSDIIKNLNKDNNKKETASAKNDNLYQEIINSHNIKCKVSVNIINYNENINNKINILKNSISLKGSADSNSNSISNTCSNSKTPKNIKNSSINLLNKNNIVLLKNNNMHFKKIDIYSRNKTNNTTLFSSINNRLLRNQTEKKLIHDNKKRGKIFSFNDYYDINLNNNNTETGTFNQSKSNKKILNYTESKKENTSSLFNKKKKTDQISNQNINNYSSKILNELSFSKITLSNKKINNKSSKNIGVKNKENGNSLFINHNNKKEKIKVENVRNINNNSFKKIEDVIIDQNFKNEIKNDELLGISSNNSSIISSFYSTKNNIFYNTKDLNSQNNDIFNDNKDDIQLTNFNNKKNELFNIYTIEYIKSIDSNLLFLELHCFINKIIMLENEFLKEYKDLYNTFLKNKNSLKFFQFLFSNGLKRKYRLEYFKILTLSKNNKNTLINEGIEFYKNSRNAIIYKNDIPFWNQLLKCNNNNDNNNDNDSINNSNKKYRLKYELIKIFLFICQKNENHFNSLSKKCYNDIRNKYKKEQNNKFIKSYDNNYINNKSSHNSSTLSLQKCSTNNNFYIENQYENNMKTPKNKFGAKKAVKKEGLIMEHNKISSFYNKIIKNNQKSSDKIKYQKNKYK